MKQKINLFAILLGFVFFVSCNTPTKNSNQKEQQSQEEQVVKNGKHDCKDVHWSHHKGEHGPENWKNLCAGFSDCGAKAQSPINIITKDLATAKNLTTPEFTYQNSSVNIINNGHTVQFNVDGENKVNLNGKDYNLLQFHYHALSEHTINNEHFPIEVHFVHKHSDTDFAVLGIMFVEGKENDLFTKYLDKFPATKGEYKSSEQINLSGLFPDNKSYYQYSGSLTTPPCSEVVSWYVLENPVEASKEQIEKFSKILDHNYRPTMPLNNREVNLYSE